MSGARLSSAGWLDLGAVFALAWVAVRFAWDIESIVDLGLTDETTFYLLPGLRMLEGVRPDLEYGPLYALWYAFLAHWIPDPLNLYYGNYFWMTVLPCPLLYAALRRLGAGPVPGMLFSVWFLVSQFNVQTWPKVSAFALVLLLACLALIPRRWNSNLAAAAGISLGVAYVRPEFVLAYALGAVWLWVDLLRRWTKMPRGVKWLGLALVALPLLVQALWGLPISRGGRSWFAFQQHFALNWVAANNSALNPWHDYRAIARETFGDAGGLAAAARANPLAMAKHGAQNAWRGLVKTSRSIWPERWVDARAWGDWAWVAVAGTSLALWGLWGWRARRTGGRPPPLRERLAELAPLAVFSVPGIASALLFTPQDHYLLFPVVFGGMAMVVVFGRPESSLDGVGRTRAGAICAVGAILLVPGAGTVSFARQDNAKTARFIRSLPLEHPLRLLEPEDGMWVYLGSGAAGLPWADIPADVGCYVQSSGVNAMLVDEIARQMVVRQGGDDWARFLRHPESLGFIRLDVPETSRYLLLAGDVALDNPSKTEAVPPGDAP